MKKTSLTYDNLKAINEAMLVIMEVDRTENYWNYYFETVELLVEEIKRNKNKKK